MPKYKVNVCRTGYANLLIPVEADTPEEAEQMAVDIAGDYEFSEHSSNYSAEGVQGPYDD